MNYTLNQLAIFVKVVKNQSITKASEELHLTQPAVSIQLKNFQDQFDLPLTEVIGRKLYVTEFGETIAKAAENILELVNEINYKTMAFKGLTTGKLNLSVVTTGKYVIPYFLSEFLKKNEAVELVMDVTNKKNVIKSLETNRVDFALVSVVPSNMLVEKLDLMRNKLFFVGNCNYQAHKKHSSPKLLETLPIIFREQGSGTRMAMENFILKNNLSILKKIELTSNEAVKQAVIAGLGFSIMPLIGIKNELQNKQLQIIPIEGLPIETTWSLIRMKGKKHSIASQAFLDYLENEKEKIIHDQFMWYEDY